MPLSTSSAPKQLSDASPSGLLIGATQNSAGQPDNIAFFGGTPAPQLLQGTLKGAFGMLNLNTVSNSPSSVLANSSSEKSFTVVGVASTDMVIAIQKPTSQAGLLVGSGRVSATNTILVTFGNNTAANVTPTTTEAYQFVTVPASLQFAAVTLSPVSVAASTTVEQVFTVPGVQPGMVMAVNKPTLNAGLVITQCRAVAPNQVGITFANCTAAAVTPTAAESYLFWGSQGMRQAPLMSIFTPALTPVSVAANTTAEQTFTVPGLAIGNGTTLLPSNLVVNKPSLQSGLAIAGYRISAANTLAITFSNETATAITPTAGEVYTVAVFAQQQPAAAANTVIPAVNGADPGAELSRFGLI